MSAARARAALLAGGRFEARRVAHRAAGSTCITLPSGSKRRSRVRYDLPAQQRVCKRAVRSRSSRTQCDGARSAVCDSGAYLGRLYCRGHMEGGVTLSDDSALCLATWCHISSQCDRALRQRAEWEVIRRRIGYGFGSSAGWREHTDRRANSACRACMKLYKGKKRKIK